MRAPNGEGPDSPRDPPVAERDEPDATTTTPPERPIRDEGWRQAQRGSKPGDRYLRAYRPRGFQRREPGHLVQRPGTGEAKSTVGRAFQSAKRSLIGNPIATEREHEERLTKVKALAVLSSDALSSVAYATEEIMKVLILAGVATLSRTLPISMVIVGLLTIVIISYRQTISAYPKGGGSYIVASDNLGTVPGLIAAASLLVDYVLTVAVSVAAGVLALTSLEPGLSPYRVELAVSGVLLLMIANLRGIRESGSIFALPTYAFILLMFGLIGWGIFKVATGRDISMSPADGIQEAGTRSVTLFLLMSAFAQGCTAMTGTEAIADGVPAFKPPEPKNARATLLAMGIFLGTMFLGLSYLARQVDARPAEESILSQVGRAIFGEGPLWVTLQIATALILVLAANTAFADFPRLASFLARDRFLPRGFQYRGDRLAFSVGIANLAAFAILLLIIFGGSLDHLIPLYAVGVFTSFTLSQTGMVVHWRNKHGPHWQRSMIINGIGAFATGVVALVIASTKFLHGAWLVLILIPLLILMMKTINGHYQRLEKYRTAETPLDPGDISIRAIVPIADLGAEARQAIAFARAITRDPARVIAVHITDDLDKADEFRRTWREGNFGAQLEIIESPFRALLPPLLGYVDELKERHPNDTITVVLPEFVPSRWWEHLLHNQTALRIKGALLFRPGIVVVSVPYHLAPSD
ncbi:MAG: APC family permease [Thermomicrobiales bacterium]